MPAVDWHAPVDKSHLLKSFADFHPSLLAVLKFVSPPQTRVATPIDSPPAKPLRSSAGLSSTAPPSSPGPRARWSSLAMPPIPCFLVCHPTNSSQKIPLTRTTSRPRPRRCPRHRRRHLPRRCPLRHRRRRSSRSAPRRVREGETAPCQRYPGHEQCWAGAVGFDS